MRHSCRQRGLCVRKPPAQARRCRSVAQRPADSVATRTLVFGRRPSSTARNAPRGPVWTRWWPPGSETDTAAMLSRGLWRYLVRSRDIPIDADFQRFLACLVWRGGDKMRDQDPLRGHSGDKIGDTVFVLSGSRPTPATGCEPRVGGAVHASLRYQAPSACESEPGGPVPVAFVAQQSVPVRARTSEAPIRCAKTSSRGCAGQLCEMLSSPAPAPASANRISTPDASAGRP